MKMIFAVILVSLATGCSLSPYGASTSGGANYTYTKTADGSCQVTINSARDVAGGEILIGEDCSVTVSAQNAGGGQAIDIVGKLVDKLK